MHPGERIRLSSLSETAGGAGRLGAAPVGPGRLGANLTGPRRLGAIAVIGLLLVVAASAAALARGGPRDVLVAAASHADEGDRLAGAERQASVPSPAGRASLDMYKQAWNLITAGRLDEAARVLKAARPRVPEAFQWLIDDGFAWVDFYRKDYADARRAFEEILSAHPGAYMSRKGLGFIEIDNGQYDVGVAHLTASFRQNPYQVLPSYTVPALKLIEAKRHDQARQILELAEWVYPKSADVAFLLARAHLGAGERDIAARKAVAAAIFAPSYIHTEFDSLKLEPALVKEAYIAMGWGLLIAADVQDALMRFEQYFAAGGDSPNAHRGRGFAYFRLQRYAEAVEDLRKAARHEPQALAPITDTVPIPGTKQRWKITYNATSTLGWAHLRAGEPDQAEKAFLRALETHPDWIDALTGLGYALLAQGNTQGAAQRFREALQVSEGYPDAIQGLRAAGYTQ